MPPKRGCCCSRRASRELEEFASPLKCRFKTCQSRLFYRPDLIGTTARARSSSRQAAWQTLSRPGASQLAAANGESIGLSIAAIGVRHLLVDDDLISRTSRRIVGYSECETVVRRWAAARAESFRTAIWRELNQAAPRQGDLLDDGPLSSDANALVVRARSRQRAVLESHRSEGVRGDFVPSRQIRLLRKSMCTRRHH